MAERWGRWLLCLNISIAQMFWFFNSNVTTFPTSGKCKHFNFSLYTVPAEMLYLQKYLMNFQKFSFGWKISKVAIVVENYQLYGCFGFAIATLTFSNIQKMLKNSIFPFTLSEQKCYIFKSIWWIFKNVFLSERWGMWLLWLKISIAQMFWFCNSNVNIFQHPENVKNSIFPFTLSEQICYIFKSI